MTRNQSVSRLSAPPTQPVKWPDAIPIKVPMTIATIEAENPTSSEIREPQISSVRIERPCLSVPSG